MNKKRKYEPKEWSWTSKLYNASALAEKATEQAEQVEYLNARIASVHVNTGACEHWAPMMYWYVNTSDLSVPPEGKWVIY